MAFENRAEILNDLVRKFPGFAPDVLFLWEEMANVNEGISEIHAKLDKLIEAQNK